MKKQISLSRLASLPDTLSVQELMLIRGGGNGGTIIKCLEVSAATINKCPAGSSAIIICETGTPAVVSCSNGSPATVSCPGGGAIIVCSGNTAAISKPCGGDSKAIVQ